MWPGMSTPHSPFPPPVDDPERRATRAAAFEDPLDETIDQSFPASDPPSSNPSPSYASESQGRAAGDWADARLHVRHEGLLWAAAGALGAAASLRLLGYRRGSSLFWQLIPAAVLAGAAVTLVQQSRAAGCDEAADW